MAHSEKKCDAVSVECTSSAAVVHNAAMGVACVADANRAVFLSHSDGDCA